MSFSNTSSWAIPRINLLHGSVSPGSNLTIGTGTVAPTIQIGGIDELTSAGAFTSVLTFNTTFGNPSYIYAATSSSQITGAFNEMTAGAQTLSNITISDANGLLSNRAITTNVLNLNGGPDFRYKCSKCRCTEQNFRICFICRRNL